MKFFSHDARRLSDLRGNGAALALLDGYLRKCVGDKGRKDVPPKLPLIFAGPSKVGKTSAVRITAGRILHQNSPILRPGSGTTHPHIAWFDYINYYDDSEVSFDIRVRNSHQYNKIVIFRDAETIPVDIQRIIIALNREKPSTQQILICESAGALQDFLMANSLLLNFGPVEKSQIMELMKLMLINLPPERRKQFTLNHMTAIADSADGKIGKALEIADNYVMAAKLPSPRDMGMVPSGIVQDFLRCLINEDLIAARKVLISCYPNVFMESLMTWAERELVKSTSDRWSSVLDSEKVYEIGLLIFNTVGSLARGAKWNLLSMHFSAKCKEIIYGDEE